MENPEILFYIVAGLIYFLTRGRKKKKRNVPSPKTSHEPVDQGNAHPPKESQLSFDDLLKELTGQATKTRAEPVEKTEPVEEPEPEPEPELEDKAKPIISKTKPLPSFDDEKIRKRYKRATVGNKIKTIAEKAAEQKKTQSFRFEEFKIKEDVNEFAEELKTMLQDPDDIKKAVILAEILNRKY